MAASDRQIRRARDIVPPSLSRDPSKHSRISMLINHKGHQGHKDKHVHMYRGFAFVSIVSFVPFDPEALRILPRRRCADIKARFYSTRGTYRSGSRLPEVTMVRRTLLFSCTLWLSIATNAAAQTGQGSLRGYVRDEQGGTLPGVTVTAASAALIQPASAVTDAEGYYIF